MWTLLGVVVCFLVLSVGVAALARSTTSRWERERARRRRPPAPPPAPAPGGVAGRVQVLRRAAGHGLASARRRGGRAVPQVTAVLRRVHLEHRHPAQLAARVVHRRGRRGPVPEPPPVGGEAEHAEERGRRGVEL